MKAEFFSKLGTRINQLPSMDAVEELYSHFPAAEHDYSDFLARRFGGESDLASVENFKRILDLFQSKGERKTFGRVMASRAGRIEDRGERMDFIQSLLDQEPPPVIANELVGKAMADLVEEPASAAEWLLQQPEEISIEGDKRFVIALANREPDITRDFVNTLFERGDRKRASRATAELARVYSRGDAGKGLDWALALPADVENRIGIITQAFVSLRGKDKQRAMAALGRVEDATIKAGVEEVFAILIESGQLKK